MIRSLVGRIQKRLSLIVGRWKLEAANVAVPDDVMDGQFAVVATEGEEAKRFILELDYLTDPAFLSLLDRAQEKYGFRHKGALTVPCSPQELQKIQNRRRNSLS